MATPATRPVAIKLDDDTKARVKRLAEARQRTSHWVMREAIAQYVVREEQREAFRLQTQEAWQHYCETGKHLSGDEADAWLAALEEGKDIDPPACHS